VTRSSKTQLTHEQRQAFGRVGVLYGGLSAEREVSLNSGEAVAKALESLAIETVRIDVQANAIDQLRAAKIDRAFIALHGAGGEDGRMQALLEYLAIPYTGSGVKSSALAMDKLRCKFMWQGMGLATPKFELLSATSNWQQVIGELGAVMVKPASEGSSIGMAPAHNAQELEQAYFEAVKYDRSVIAEQLISGAEYTVSILGDEVLEPIKLETDHQFYDYDAKYIANDTRYLCPCGLPPEADKQLRQLCLHAFNSLDCEGWGRVDCMADEQGNFYLLEVNTSPGMTDHSLVPMSAAAENMDFADLVLNILQHSLASK